MLCGGAGSCQQDGEGRPNVLCSCIRWRKAGQTDLKSAASALLFMSKLTLSNSWERQWLLRMEYCQVTAGGFSGFPTPSHFINFFFHKAFSAKPGRTFKMLEPVMSASLTCDLISPLYPTILCSFSFMKGREERRLQANCLAAPLQLRKCQQFVSWSSGLSRAARVRDVTQPATRRGSRAEELVPHHGRAGGLHSSWFCITSLFAFKSRNGSDTAGLRLMLAQAVRPVNERGMPSSGTLSHLWWALKVFFALEGDTGAVFKTVHLQVGLTRSLCDFCFQPQINFRTRLSFLLGRMLRSWLTKEPNELVSGEIANTGKDCSMHCLSEWDVCPWSSLWTWK